MNRKKHLGGILTLCVFCLAWSHFASGFSGRAGQAEQQKTSTAAASPKQLGMVYKTYTLKYIKAESLLRAAKMFFTDATSYDNSVTVLIYEGNIPRFEELLSKLDVEKKTIQFQIYAVVASRGAEPQGKPQNTGEDSGGILTLKVTPAHAKAKDISTLLRAKLSSRGEITVDDQTNTIVVKDIKASLDQIKDMLPAMDTPAPQAGPAGAPVPRATDYPSQAGKYTGETLNLKFKDADLRDVVLYIAEFARLNVIFDVNVRGTVTCNLKDIPWDQALDIVLSQNRMGKTIEGKILKVAPVYVFSREQNPDKGDVIENKELKKVLDELKALWNFTTYAVDGPTFVTMREDSGPNNVKLVSNRPLNVMIWNPKIGGEESGKRTISLEQVMLTGPTASSPDMVYLNTHDIALKEKGYLVAGVSGYESSRTALILVISAEIK